MADSMIRNYIEFYLKTYDYFKNNFSEENPLPPLNIYIEPINICNLECPFCATSILRRKRQQLNFELYKRVIDSICINNFNNIIRLTLAGQGEPLLNKKLFEMVKYAKSKGFLYVELITNATLLDESAGKRLIEAGLDRIQFSIDSIDKNTYDILRMAKRKGISYFYDTMTNILNFLKLNVEGDYGVYTAISAVLTSLNRDQRENFVNFWSSLPVDNIYFPPLSTLQNNNPSNEAVRFNGDIKDKPICIIPWISLSVKSNGDIIVCSHDYHNVYPVGNILTDDLIDAWNNERTKRLRKALIDAELTSFIEIGHDCYSCNNPNLGCGKDDFINDIPVYMEKTVIGKLIKTKYFDKTKLYNLEKVISLAKSGEL